MKNIQIIDLFAGPGGLGEGFSAYKHKGSNPFTISISIEKELFAHKTLTLRSFFRQFKKTPKEYYNYLREEIDIERLFELYPIEAEKAKCEAWKAELGSPLFPQAQVTKKIKEQLIFGKDCIIIGGPPCQAYSLVGRSKMSKTEHFEKDPRHTLYKEYLKIIAEFKPSVFVMENVKGILSSKLNGELVFDKILEDLRNPQKALKIKKTRFTQIDQYTIYSLSTDKSPLAIKNNDFVIKTEEYGVPQSRHRVILLGIRNDIKEKPACLKVSTDRISVEDAIADLPKLRSGLSKSNDSYESWKTAIQSYDQNFKVHKNLNRGGNFIPIITKPSAYVEWYHDHLLKGTLNHESRSHIVSDLHRYYYAASYTEKKNESPNLGHFPKNLLPQHKNVEKAIKSKSLFTDRFKVQARQKPSSTITSHISKDGHYFIHYDPKQCRTLTVREAARIQTFPDNYKFEGPRTSQYQQVGNAVPPLLAKQIAEIVYDLMKRHSANSGIK